MKNQSISQHTSDELKQQVRSPKKVWTRRRLLKAIAIGSGTVVASTLLPERWVKPVVQASALPAHAQVSGEPVQYLLNCSINEDDSFPGYEIIDITATVTATGGASVEGIQVQYIAESITPPGTTTDPVFGTTDGTGSANLGDFFFCQDFDTIEITRYRIVLSFVDTATYGDATCTLGPYDVQGC
jgi:hypothetical protein